MGSAGTSYFSALPEVETDEVFTLMGMFHEDTFPDRVNLGAGVYCTDEGKSWPLEVVGRVEKSLLEQQDVRRHDYLAIEGDAEFLELARDLTFSSIINGPSPEQVLAKARTVSVQTISGTGANHIGARFLTDHLRPRNVWLSDPTWANHHTIWKCVGLSPKTYPYYNPSTSKLDFDAMMEALEREAEPCDVVVLHACAHNPTGLDPTREQWKQIADLCQRKQLFPFFDNAYQGFASGDPVKDGWAIRYFTQLQPPMEMCVAQSFAKNFGLYGQRAGAFHMVLNDTSKAVHTKVRNHFAQLIRTEYSVSPRYGTTIVKTILKSEDLTKQWLADLQVISGRIRLMRQELYNELVRLGTPGSWNHVIDQIGMFSYTGLTPPEIQILRKQYHIYMLSSGRISVAGLNTKNVHYVAAAIHDLRTRKHIE